MRIESLDLKAFGPFTGALLDLSAGAEGLHLIFGPNEAGKSSTLRAIQQFFRGIDARTSDDFIHKYDEMRIGAVLRTRAGETLSLVRRKGAKNTLLGPNGDVCEDGETRLAKALGGIAPEEFLKKFVIDHAELVAGGSGMIEASGNLGQALFAAASGHTGLGQIQRKLEDEAAELFKRNASKPRINSELAALEKARKTIKEAILSSTQWLTHDEALRSAQIRKDAHQRELDNAIRTLSQLRRISDALEPIARLKEVRASQKELVAVPRLTPEFTERRLAAVASLRPTIEAEANALREIETLDSAIKECQFSQPLLDYAEAIETLYRRLGRIEQAIDDQNRFEVECAQCDADARAVLRAIGQDQTLLELSDDSVERFRLTSAERATIQDLAESRLVLFKECESAREALSIHSTKAQAKRKKYADLGVERDPAVLRKLIKNAQALGNVDEQLQTQHESARRETARLKKACATLGLIGSIESLEALLVPSVETIERFSADLDESSSLLVNLQRRRDELETEARHTEARIEELHLVGEIPTEDALLEARHRRDALWLQLKTANVWEDKLASSYEAALRDTDERADRLRREAHHVAEYARLQADVKRQAAIRADLMTKSDLAEVERKAIQEAWIRHWEAIGLAILGTPREMLAWSRRVDELRKQVRTLHESLEAQQVLQERLKSQREVLSDALEKLSEPAVSPDETLSALIERAENVADTIQKETATRKRVVEELESLELERPLLEQRTLSAANNWEHWQTRWGEVMARVGQHAEALPASANALLEQTARLFEKLDRAQALRRQITNLAQAISQFNTETQAIAGRVAQDLETEKDPCLIAVQLHARLNATRDTVKRREAIATQRNNAHTAVECAKSKRLELEGILEALQREAQSGSVDALPEIEARSRQRQQLEKEESELTASLSKLASGVPLATFLTDAESADPDAIAVETARLDAEIATLQKKRESVDQEIGSEITLIQQMNGSQRAADASQEFEELRAKIKEDAEQYARLRLASIVLRDTLERYRQKAQTPVLKRASGLFQTLTLGSFNALRIDYNDRDEPVLKGERKGKSTLVGVDGMSTGTADQLYLSLRLATLEAFLDNHEPLPLIVDDLLIQFDDARAHATLKILAEISKRTQVLMFTHHEHLIQLACKAVPADILTIHTLGTKNA